MTTQNLPDNFQIKDATFSSIRSKKLIIILGSIVCVSVLVIFFGLFFSRTQPTVPTSVITKPIGWTAQDAVAKAALVDSVATRSMQPLSAQAVKSKQNILQSINRK